MEMQDTYLILIDINNLWKRISCLLALCLSSISKSQIPLHVQLNTKRHSRQAEKTAKWTRKMSRRQVEVLLP